MKGLSDLVSNNPDLKNKVMEGANFLKERYVESTENGTKVNKDKIKEDAKAVGISDDMLNILDKV